MVFAKFLRTLSSPTGQRRRRWATSPEALEDRLMLTLLTNGDFETGDLSGWTTYTTQNGTIGQPVAVQFDVDGDGSSSESARFLVGQQSFQPNVHWGGGIFQTFVSSGGDVEFSADIAARDPDSVGNISGGQFSLIVDGVTVDQHDFGGIGGFMTERSTLSATVNLSAGTHEVRFLMTRPFLARQGGTPFQYLDDISAIPSNEPPVANDDTAVTDEDVAVLIDATANDTDPDNNLDPSTATVVTGPASGTLVNNGDGTFTYTPDADFNGSDSFTYEVSDTDGASDTATVSITVNSVVDALIDVKPGNGDDVDPINLKSKGKTPIAILATQTSSGETDDFDPSAVDLDAISYTINGQSIVANKMSIQDVDGDGDDDLLIHFLTVDLADILTQDDTVLTLTAEFGGDALGDDLSGSDAIKIVPKKGK